MKIKLKYFIFLAAFIGLITLVGSTRTISLAETVDFDAALQDVAQEQSDLQRQLKKIESQITGYQKDLKTVRGQKNTLQNKLSILGKEQAALELEIEANGLEAQYLSLETIVTQNEIKDTAEEISGLGRQIGLFLRLIHQNDQVTLLDAWLNNNTLADVFRETENYGKITEALSVLHGRKQKFDKELNGQKEKLAAEEEDIRNLLALQKLREADLTDTVNEKNKLLKETKNKESNYQLSLTSSQKKAQEIRGRLYQLLEVEKQITFGQAVQIAEWASSETGVRPAFILSVLTQESNLGRNVGTCNRAGDPPSKSYKVIMHPTRDIPPFKIITKELGLNPDTTPVSCPMRDKKGKQVGWGGAMGPAQFIPSTWMGYRGKVAAITGKAANPWDIRDAFLASAIKLANDGAKTKSGEWAAAMRYFSGSTNTKYRFYGDSVVARAETYQADIDELNK